MELSLGLAPGDAVEAAEEEDGGGEAEPADREEAGEEVEVGEAGSVMLVTVCCGLGTGSGLAALWKIRICGGLSTSRHRDTPQACSVSLHEGEKNNTPPHSITMWTITLLQMTRQEASK